ncbi:hypothetical protein X943_003129 [Babesia divergens]|uniref:Uncharacterized protein n=1 Tax=Babesia divergens TaxID=32595 RepID=A0AAD9LEG7_BABDI|nr:hypothetical protein X943_003129 [Babesia divergens]
MEIFVETVKVLTTSLSKYATSMIVSATSRSQFTNRAIRGIGRARHRSSVRRKLSGRIFSFNPSRENADTKVEVIVKPINDEEAIQVRSIYFLLTMSIQLGADLVADVLLMSLMFTYMFYSFNLRRKKYNDLCNKQTEQTQFIIARLDYLESELHKLQKSTS